MAEAIALIGLTSSAITFVDFSLSFLSRAKSAYHAAEDTFVDVEQLDAVLANLENRRAHLQAAIAATGQDVARVGDKKLLGKLMKDCFAVGTELRALCQKLTIKPNTFSRTLESGRVAFESMRKAPQFKELRERLLSLDAAILQNLKLSLNVAGHSRILQEFEGIRKLHMDLEILHSWKLDSAQESINSILELARRNQQGVAEQTAQLTSLNTKLITLQQDVKLCKQQASVLKSLYSSEINRRWSLIPRCKETTNRWLFDPSQTTFPEWLERGTGIFHIGGLAGSGKSTLVKYACSNVRTLTPLKRWASPRKLCIASFFFWNQGFDKQKSQIGLLQSLIYQILRNEPDVIAHVVPNTRLEHETWDFEDLISTFKEIISRTEMSTRFCFFIDGLDEYDGDEESIAKLTLSIAESSNIKICASSRPRTIFEDRLWSSKYALQMQHFTKRDMQTYVRKELQPVRIAGNQAQLQQIVVKISAQAKGVWLWVSLVTRDLVSAANRKEGWDQLEEIVESFPKDLKDYFGRIIAKVELHYQKDMARIFLVALTQVQPLPLYAFSLIVKEAKEPTYATTAEISRMDPSAVKAIEASWKDLLRNRCSDLLVIEEADHPTVLSRPVDFLHRTVRDYLQDHFYSELTSKLSNDFNPALSLCRIMLFFLKKLDHNGFQSSRSRGQLISIVDELLYYAQEAEQMSSVTEATQGDLAEDRIYAMESPDHVGEILDEVDRVCAAHLHSFTKVHWTHIRDAPYARGLDEYREGGKYNWLALCVQSKQLKYVQRKVMVDSRVLSKPGRPLLDYALRPRRVTSIVMPYHSQRDEPNIDLGMVGFLLDQGADPNQSIWLNDGKSVWDMFLICCWEWVRRDEIQDIYERAWYRACEMMIDKGANGEFSTAASTEHSGLPSLSKVLQEVFGKESGNKLVTRLDYRESERTSRQSWFRRWLG